MASSFGGSKTFRNFKLWSRKFWRFEGRFGLVTSGIPLIAMCYFMMYVGVVVMDKQAEHRFLRVQSLTQRELSIQEEREAIREMLSRPDPMYDVQPIAKQNSSSMEEKYSIPKKHKLPSGKEIDLSPLLEGAFVIDPKDIERGGPVTDKELIERFIELATSKK